MALYTRALKRLRPYVTGKQPWNKAAVKLRKRYSRKIRRVDSRGA